MKPPRARGKSYNPSFIIEAGERSVNGPDKGSPSKGSDAEFWRLMRRYVPLIGVMPGCILAGYLIGAGLDHLFSTRYLTLVFIMLGFVAGTVQVIRLLSRDAE
jgi:F0F1-type ATP synthase assembly protein I